MYLAMSASPGLGDPLRTVDLRRAYRNGFRLQRLEPAQEQAYAVPRPAPGRLAVLLVRPPGPRDVEMGPAPATGELAEEERGGDRATVEVRRRVTGVAEVGDRRVHRGAVVIGERHPPQLLTACCGARDQRV